MESFITAVTSVCVSFGWVKRREDTPFLLSLGGAGISSLHPLGHPAASPAPRVWGASRPPTDVLHAALRCVSACSASTLRSPRGPFPSAPRWSLVLSVAAPTRRARRRPPRRVIMVCASRRMIMVGTARAGALWCCPMWVAMMLIPVFAVCSRGDPCLSAPFFL